MVLPCRRLRDGAVPGSDFSILGSHWAASGERASPRIVSESVSGSRLFHPKSRYRRHHHYLTVVTDHVRARVVWVSRGRNADTVREFFAALGDERSAKLQIVTMDLSGSYISAVTEKAPQARLVFDRFHVQRLAHDALDEVRRAQARELRGTDEGKALKHSRWALQKNPWNLTQRESEKLVEVHASGWK